MSSPEAFESFSAQDSLGFGHHALPEEWPVAPNGLAREGSEDNVPRLMGGPTNGILRAYRPPRERPAPGHLFVELDRSEFSTDDRAGLGDWSGGAWIQSPRYPAESQQLPQRTIEGEQ